MVEEYLEDLKNHSELNNYVVDYYIDRNYSDIDNFYQYNNQLHNYIDRNYSDIDNLIKDMEDLQRYGGVSGMIQGLIYYDETSEFYDKYKDEINDLLSNNLNDYGLSIEEFFKDRFDNDDPLVLDYLNKNLLAWYAFEETAYQIYEKIEEKIKYGELDYNY